MNRAAHFLLLTLGLGACSKSSETTADAPATAKKFSLSDQTLKELAFDTVRLEPVRSE